ncbi:nickel ABC transporter substrate-binding protein [Alkalihalobacillus sp. FSL R5-0424]
MINRTHSIIGITLTSALLLGACSTGEADNQGFQAPDEHTLTFAWPYDIGEMDPHVYVPSQLFAQSMMYEPLVTYGEGGELIPHLAESWDISEDGLEYTFHLRDDVEFTNGTTFDADAVQSNFENILENIDIHSWLGFIPKINDTEAVDEYTFKITLTEPYYPTLQELTVVRPVRFGDTNVEDLDPALQDIQKSVGTGPWILDEYKVDEYATFVRNDDYWGDLPEEESLTIKVIPDAETRVLAFEKGDVDLIYGEGIISLDSFKQLESTGEYKTSVSDPVATRQLVMNTTKEQLSDERVRQALHYGFNKQGLVEGVTSGLEEAADYILPPNMPYTSNIDATPIEYDPDKAIELLEEAGWTLPNGSQVREKDGQPLEFELMYNTSESIQKTMAETLQSEWTALGVKLDIVGIELSTQIERFKANDFDMNFFSNYGAPYDPHTFANIIATEGFGFNEAISSYENKDEIIEQIDTVLKSTDEAEREELYREILGSLQEQAAIVPISYVNKIALYQEDISDFTFSPNRDEHSFSGIKRN